MVHDYAVGHKDGHDVLFTEYVHISSLTKRSHDTRTTLLISTR